MIVLIPAYEPGGTLTQLVRDLRASESEPHVVVVDDGSGAAYAGEFDAARRASKPLQSASARLWSSIFSNSPTS